MVAVVFAPVNNIPVSAPFRDVFLTFSEVIRPDGKGICPAIGPYFQDILGNVPGSFSRLLGLIWFNLMGFMDVIFCRKSLQKHVKSNPTHYFAL